MTHAPINGNNGEEQERAVRDVNELADALVVDARQGMFILVIDGNGAATIRARCSTEQAIEWLTMVLEGIKNGEVGPGEGEVDL